MFCCNCYFNREDNSVSNLKQKIKDWQDKNPNSTRWKIKKEHIKELSNNIDRLRGKLSRDLDSDDEKIFLSAVIISIMDKTAERVGNIKSACKGNFGVTCFTRDHVKVIGNKILLDYVGKRGVPHLKDFSNTKIANAIKKAIKNSPKKIEGKTNEFIFVTSEGLKINDGHINDYLLPYRITSKAIRGYFANRSIIKMLESADIPESEKERKKLFNRAVKQTAGVVQHGPGILKKSYMIPELQTEYVEHGRIIDIKNLKSCECIHAFMENNYPGLCVELAEKNINQLPKLRAKMDKAYERFTNKNHKS